MRNPLIQMLPAGSSVDIAVVPPIAAEERPFVLTMHGAASPVTVEVVNGALVRVRNPMGILVPFVFFIGPQRLPPQWMSKVLGFISSLRPRAAT